MVDGENGSILDVVLQIKPSIFTHEWDRESKIEMSRMSSSSLADQPEEWSLCSLRYWKSSSCLLGVRWENPV